MGARLVKQLFRDNAGQRHGVEPDQADMSDQFLGCAERREMTRGSLRERLDHLVLLSGVA